MHRAKILLLYVQGNNILPISKQLKVSRPTIYKCVDKALAAGISMGLIRVITNGSKLVISDEAKAWVISLACAKPKDLGLAVELWTYRELAKYAREKGS